MIASSHAMLSLDIMQLHYQNSSFTFEIDKRVINHFLLLFKLKSTLQILQSLDVIGDENLLQS